LDTQCCEWPSPNRERQGIVYRKSQGSYTVHVQGEIIECAISSALRKHLVRWWENSQSSGLKHYVENVRDIKLVDPVAVGDRVRLVPAPDQDQARGMIVEVLPRASHLSRVAAQQERKAGPQPLEQVLIANVDQVVAVFAVRDPKPKWTLLDRYLVSAEDAGIPAVFVLSKIDLLRDPARLEGIVQLYEGIGYRVIQTSVVNGDGIETFARALRGRVSALLGKSGVGKTSLLNAIQPDLGLRVNEVNQATGKGRHTTSHLEMFPLDGGGAVVDMPGIREFGMWTNKRDDLAPLFVEMRPYIGHCRFGLTCRHISEPDCAIKEAVKEGEIDARRYQSYSRLMGDPKPQKARSGASWRHR